MGKTADVLILWILLVANHGHNVVFDIRMLECLQCNEIAFGVIIMPIPVSAALHGDQFINWAI